MGYRLDDKEIKKFNVRLIGKGKKGNVYRFHDAALKLFKEDIPPIEEETAKYLTSISTDRILLPINLVFYNNKFRGYTYKLVPKKGSGQRMTMLPKTDLVQDIRILERDIDTLTDKSVLLSGLDETNSIFNGELYLTDPSGYSVLEDMSKDELNRINKFQLHLLLVKLIKIDLNKTNFSTKANIDEIERMLKTKDADENSSDFFAEIISKNDTVREFVKKL
ncbi:MAG: hypothetical protein IKF47_00295 [Bacilli bacterium]|nr:hypothetical protein [Bacilli bacterium]